MANGIYEPWSALQRLQEDVNRILGAGRTAGDDESSVVTGRWVPAVDIREEQDRFVLEADVPGVDPDSIEVTMENGVLTIKGERGAADPALRETYRRVERVHGPFYRRFSLPDTADPEGVAAACRNGVLEVSIPKRRAVQPRRIEVRG